MKFGPLPLAQAEGALLAHALRAGGRAWRKAHVVTADDIAALQAAGVSSVIVAKLDGGDMTEDAAASAIASAMGFGSNIAVKPAATGRVNLHAVSAGIFRVDAARVNAVNAVDAAITLATLADYAPAAAGQMVATVKIIPFAVAGDLVEKAVAVVSGHTIFEVLPFASRRVAMVQTVLPGTKPGVLDKTRAITQARLDRSASRLTDELRTGHDSDEVAAALRRALPENDMAIVFGASAMSDFGDVIPQAIRSAGGSVVHAGMPVDPGNLLVLGEIGGKTVLGAPGCARSPKENGFDWVLDRIMAGIAVGAGDIARMGVGGLLMEIPTRPLPRENAAAPVAEAQSRRDAAEVHVVLLAAGRSSRMGGPNKLLALFQGKPLVRRAAEQALRAAAASVVVVTGHQEPRIRAALAGLPVRFAANPDFAEGLAASLRAGLAALPASADAALVMLADMPAVEAAHLDRLIANFRLAGALRPVRAAHAGRAGNPVVLPRSLFAEVAGLSGDIGARKLLEREELGVIDVEIGEGASLDVDTAQAMEAAGGVLQG